MRWTGSQLGDKGKQSDLTSMRDNATKRPRPQLGDYRTRRLDPLFSKQSAPTPSILLFPIGARRNCATGQSARQTALLLLLLLVTPPPPPAAYFTLKGRCSTCKVIGYGDSEDRGNWRRIKRNEWTSGTKIEKCVEAEEMAGQRLGSAAVTLKNGDPRRY